MDSIVAQSTAGVFTQMLDHFRVQVVYADLLLYRIVRGCRFKEDQDDGGNDIESSRRLLARETTAASGDGQETPRRRKSGRHRTERFQAYLPPAPGRRQRTDFVRYPRGKSNKAIAVQGRYCGFVSKAIAILIDVITVTALFSLLMIILQLAWIYFVGLSKESAVEKTDRTQHSWVVAIFCIYWFLYFFLCVQVTGQTIGMAIVGLKVCDVKSHSSYASVSVGQAFIRTATLPLTLTLFPPLGVIGAMRRDGRMIHDLVAKTGIIYLWDAKLAKLRERHRAEQDAALDAMADNIDPDADEVYDNVEVVVGEEAQAGAEVFLPRSSSTYSTFSEKQGMA